MLDYLFAELEHPDTLLTNEIAVGSLEENLALSLLLGLPHNYSERIGTYAAMEPFIAPSRYVNYLDDDETGDSGPAAYGPNYRRLQKIKTKYDPGNFFHLNQNIRPLM